jgi:hypothetical protein
MFLQAHARSHDLKNDDDDDAHHPNEDVLHDAHHPNDDVLQNVLLLHDDVLHDVHHDLDKKNILFLHNSYSAVKIKSLFRSFMF